MTQMIRISEAASIALHAGALLAAHPERLLRTQEIADVLDVSEAHLSKVLQRLAREGLVRPMRGPGGGFRLSRPAHEISLREIYEAIDGPVDALTCPFQVAACKGRRCVLGVEFTSKGKELLQYLSETRLSEFRLSFGHKLAHR